MRPRRFALVFSEQNVEKKGFINTYFLSRLRWEYGTALEIYVKYIQLILE